MRRPLCTLITLVIVLSCALIINVCGQSSNKFMQFEEHSIRIHDDLDLKYYTSGAGSENIILIHGLGSNKDAWLKLIPELSEDFTVYAIDLPKYLNSDKADIINMQHFGECVASFAGKLQIDKFYLCGHSMGGQVAIHMALNKIEGLQGLVLVSPAGLEAFSESDHNWFNTYVTKSFFLSQNEARVKYNFDINFYGNKLPEDAQFMLETRLQLMEDSLRYTRYIDYTLACIKAMLNEPVHEYLSEVDYPTLVLFGANDGLIPNRILHPDLTTEDVLNKGQQFPNSTTALIPEAGHFLPWDQPTLLATKIKEYIIE